MAGQGWRTSRIIDAVGEDGRTTQVVVGEVTTGRGPRLGVRIGPRGTTALLGRQQRSELAQVIQALNDELRRYR